MPTVWWEDGRVRLVDQRRLPEAHVILDCRTADDVAEAIRQLAVRGAPAIGAAAAYGLALAARAEAEAGAGPPAFLAALDQAAERLRRTRPTAVNLAWAVRRVLAAAREPARQGEVQAAAARALAAAHAIADEDVRANRAIGAHGVDLVPEGARILTICNTGALATVDYGTALGVVRAAHDAGRRVHVWVTETRPVLQGARLTAWELREHGIPHTLITDGAAAHFMARGEVDLVLAGADRVARNGDVANKIGTYGLAVLARAHQLPFYVAAPTSTVDLDVPSGDAIPIEERDPAEVTHLAGRPVAPEGTPARNPAFDVTPAAYVSAIITEAGVVRPPYPEGLAAACRAAARQGRAGAEGRAGGAGGRAAREAGRQRP